MNKNFNINDYELIGGSAKIPEGLKLNEEDIVFIEGEIIIARHMTNYYWWEKKGSSNNIKNFCKANAKIDELKLIDKGYPLSELKKEIEIIKGCKSLDDVRSLKSNHATEIKWHDILWTSYRYDGHDDRVVWEPIPIKNGTPTRAPKYVSRDAYYEWGQKYYMVKEIK